MGLTISSKNNSIDLGYVGFNRLRTKISELINDEIAEHYKECDKSTFIFNEDEKKKFFKKYNAKTTRLDKKYGYKYNSILHFLYACDCGATMETNVCKKIYEIIKDYDDNFLYGYAGRKDCAMFKDFKEVVKDCIDNNCDMEWY
jgi:DNA-binding ferritin-like protein (Dps family)